MHDVKNEIPVSEGLDAAVAEGMRRVKEIHRRRVIKRTVGMVAGLAVFCAAFLAWGYSNPVLASQIPVIGRIFASVQGDVTFSGDYAGKVQMLDAADTETTPDSGYVYSASDRGYTFTAGEVYCDGYSLYLGLTVQKEGGFGEIATTPVSGYGDDRVQFIALYGISVQPEGGDRAVFQDIPNLEGLQTAEDTFEGVVRLSLADAGMILESDVTVKIELEWFMYWDEALSRKQEENYNAHVVRDEDGNPVSDGNGMEVMDKTYQPVNSRYNETGSWNLCIPVTIDASEIREYEVNDARDGIGIASVIVTPYEIRVSSILPPLVSDGEAPDEDQRNYGVAVFDDRGMRLEPKGVMEGSQGPVYTYAVQERWIGEVHIYVGKGDIESMKETSEKAMADRALYHVDVDFP